MNTHNKNSFTAYLVLFIVFFSVYAQAIYATEHNEITSVHSENAKFINEVGTGTLLLRDDSSSHYEVATLLETSASVSISGPVATTELRQSFMNTGFDFAESIYVFPLPENSAVEYMEIQVRDRRIVGQIMEKQQAKKVYVQAKREGKRTALVEQSRPNLFTTKVANIPAGERITVVLRFNQSLSMTSNKGYETQYEYRLPLTLTPRYQAGPINPDLIEEIMLHKSPKAEDESGVHAGNSSRGPIDSTNGTGQDAIFPPQIKLSNPNNIRNSVNIQVEIHGLNHDSDVSSLYQVLEQKSLDQVRLVNFKHTDVAMDQDFVLQWSMNQSNENQAQIFTENIQGKEYGLLLISPPQIATHSTVLPREVIFIIDSSGSMGGASMRQAKQSLSFALDKLAPHERFNIIDFDSQFTKLFSEPRAADSQSINKARRFVSGLQAGGGTKMAPALASALTMATDQNYLKQIIFITDGSVSNEAQLFSLLHDNLGKSRLFTVGIGSAPNSYFMRKAAEFGRGSFTYIGSIDEVKPQMSALFKKIGSPVLQDIELIFPDGTIAERWPEFIPDLYVGEPVVIPVQFNQRPQWVTLRGRSDQPWEQTIVINQSKQHPGIASVWARKKIESLMDKMVRGASEEEIKPKVLEVALNHNLMSKYTSFVAVDERPVRDKNAPLKSGKIPNLLPKGSQYPATASGLNLWLILTFFGFVLSLLSFRTLHWPQSRVMA